MLLNHFDHSPFPDITYYYPKELVFQRAYAAGDTKLRCEG